MSLATTIAIMNSYKDTVNELPGVEADKERIDRMFSGTTIIKLYDKIKTELKVSLSNIDVKTNDIIIYYAGHGYQGEDTIPGISTTDSKILITEIMNILRSKYNNKNLYIIMDSCRTEAKSSPVLSDRYTWGGIFLIFHPTREGAGTSEHNDGSVYMKCLTEKEGFTTNIVPTLYETSILYKNNRLTKYNETKNERYKSQMPEFYVNSTFRTIYPAYTKAIKLLCANDVEATKYGEEIARSLTDVTLLIKVVFLRLKQLDTNVIFNITRIIGLMNEAKKDPVKSVNDGLVVLKEIHNRQLKEIKAQQELEQNEIKTTNRLIAIIKAKIAILYPDEKKIDEKTSDSQSICDNIDKCISIIHKNECVGISKNDTDTLANLLIKYTLINKIQKLKTGIINHPYSYIKHNLTMQTIQTNIKIIDDCIAIMPPSQPS